MYNSWKFQQDCYESWRDYLTRFPWQWLSTLTFTDGVGFFPALHLFKKWRYKIIDMEKLRVGASLMSCHKRGKLHYHVLMIGQNREGKSLLSCDPRRWEKEWDYHARIKKVEDNWKACSYVASHFHGFRCDYCQTEVYDLNLLKQVMEPQFDGLDDLDRL